MVIVKPIVLLAAATPCVLSATYTVTVGIDQNTGQVGNGFDPDRVVPAVGDEIIFTWAIPSYIENPPTGSYSVTQGSADAPCQPLSGGFDTGPQTTAPEAAGNAFSQTFAVTSADPLYFYSSVDGQCQSGMALGVNTPPAGDGSIDSYISKAAGGATPSDTGNPTTTSNTTSTIGQDPNNSTVNGNVTSIANGNDTSTTTGNDTSTTNDTLSTTSSSSTPLPTSTPTMTQNLTYAPSLSSSSHPSLLPTSEKGHALPCHSYPQVWYVSVLMTLAICAAGTVL